MRQSYCSRNFPFFFFLYTKCPRAHNTLFYIYIYIFIYLLRLLSLQVRLVVPTGNQIVTTGVSLGPFEDVSPEAHFREKFKMVLIQIHHTEPIISRWPSSNLKLLPRCGWAHLSAGDTITLGQISCSRSGYITVSWYILSFRRWLSLTHQSILIKNKTFFGQLDSSVNKIRTTRDRWSNQGPVPP